MASPAVVHILAIRTYYRGHAIKLTFVELVTLSLDLVSGVRREDHIVHKNLKDAISLRKLTGDKLEDKKTRFCVMLATTHFGELIPQSPSRI